MRPQRRPFAVEVKSRRKLPLSNAAIWPSDQPYLDDVPAREVHADLEVASSRGSPASAKLRGWGDQPEPPVKALRGLAARVFAAPAPEAVPEATIPLSPETLKNGRILPCLVQATEAQVDQEPQRRRQSKRAIPQAAAELTEFAPELPHIAADMNQPPESRSEPVGAGPTQPDDAEVPQVGLASSAPQEIEVISLPTKSGPEAGGRSGERPLKLSQRKGAGRVRAGEQWKRRRLPKALGELHGINNGWPRYLRG
jgi:hypothetical protein